MVANILVVDDSRVERLLVEGLLRRCPGYRIDLAENGRQALERITAAVPDLIVTDLIMPEMDGLELTQTVRRRYPAIPVILMTAYGDETTAVEALEAGAASYVPKAEKAERLLSAVERVLDHAQANRTHEQLSQCMLEYHCRYALQNDRRLIRALAAQVQQVMANIGFASVVERIRMGEALEEALLNAMYHGNLEISHEELCRARAELDEAALEQLVADRCREPRIRNRRILVVVGLSRGEARFVVRDEGRGFRIPYFPEGSTADRCASGEFRGMTLIRAMMDRVSFNASGNELVMCKHSSAHVADGTNGSPPHLAD